MKGDFSRVRYEGSKQYTSVLMQQGRVQLDSDANEQRLIDEHLRLSMLRDVVGATGAPAGDAGFLIAPTPAAAPTSISIGAGRFYVNGLLCENPAVLDFTAQPNLSSSGTAIGTLISGLQAKTSSAVRIFLEAWQRFATPIDDPAIHEVALGAADTAGRLQTLWRVTAAPLPVAQPVATQISGIVGDLQMVQNSLNALPATSGFPSYATQITAALTALQATGAGVPAFAAAVGVWSQVAASITSFSGTDTPQFDAVVAATNNLGLALATMPTQLDCCAMPAYQPVRVPGTLNAQCQPATAPSPSIVTPTAGYRGVENQLYRVEIQTGGTPAQATFKWSRDNGSVLTGVTAVNGSTLTVTSLGHDSELGFAALQWVELTDDSNDLNADPPNRPGTLVQIQSVDPTQTPPTVTLTAATPPPALNVTTGHAKMRRWDQNSAAIPIAAGTWLSLENGIQVQFSTTGTYNAGDAWLIPARTATGTIDWPSTGGATPTPLAQQPWSTNVQIAAIACLHLDGSGHVTAEDCRGVFQPLVALTPPPGPPLPPPALHVNSISWANDDLMTLDNLTLKGLSLVLDGTPTGPVDSRNFLVTVDMPFAVAIPAPGVAGGQAMLPVVLAGTVISNGGTLAWSLPDNARDTVGALSAASEFYAASGLYMQARVTLKGHAVIGTINGAPAWLDGQCFGKPGTRFDNTPRVDYSYPSGNGAKASDFESWFSVAPVAVPTLTISPASVTLTAASPSPAVNGIVTLTFNALAATTVTLAITQTGTAPTVPSPTGILTETLGPTSPYVSIPASVVVPKAGGTPSQTFPIKITANPGGNTATVTFSATVQLASGFTPPAATATLTIIGYVPPPAPVGQGGTVLLPGSLFPTGSLHL